MVRENSAIGVGMVFAGNGSRADSPATAFNNPAGMSYLRDKGVELGTAAILPVMNFRGAATAFGQAIPGSGGSKDSTSVIPNLYWVGGNSRLTGGIAITAPFGMGNEYDSTWAGRYVGIKTQAFTVDINPSVAYRLSDSVSIGAGISAQYFKFDMTSALPQFVIFGPATPDALYRFRGDDWAAGFNVGVLWAPTTTTRIGLTYRSKIDHQLKGSLEFTGALPVLGLTSGAASAGVRLPATAGLSISHDTTPSLSFSADVQFTNWSVLKQAIITSANPPFPMELGYRDSWFVSAGGSYNVNPALTLRAGLGWDQTPVTDAFRAVNLPDADRLLAGIGLTYRFTQALALDGGYQHSFPAHPASMNASINNTDPLTHAVTLNGRYNVNVDVVALSLRYKN
jgi:long-chain fatty acid transport protein